MTRSNTRYVLWVDRDGQPRVVETLTYELDKEEIERLIQEIGVSRDGKVLILSPEWEVRALPS